MAEKLDREVFVSYAWEKESEQIVEKLDRACQLNNIKLVRDKTGIHFKGLISDFMKRLGQGRFVVAIISDRYLKSENCMFELLEIAKNGSFSSRIFPIILETASFYKPLGRINYIKYWEEKITELNDGMIGLQSQADLNGIREAIDLYTRIRATIADLTNIIKDMNCLTLEEHVNNNFIEIFQSINEEISPIEEKKEIGVDNKTPFTKELRLISNLLKLTLPTKLYIAELKIDRNEIIEKTWNTPRPLKKKKATQREVMQAALRQMGKLWYKDYHVFENKVITFRDLSNSELALFNLVEKATIEEINCEDFIAIKGSYTNNFISLVNYTFQQLCFYKDIELVPKSTIYRFKINQSLTVKKVKWKGIKEATRTVVFEKMNKEKTAIVAFRHLAFKANLVHLNNEWYFAINPTWNMTVDGKKPYAFQASDISGLKRLENNSSVQNHFRFISYYFRTSINENDNYPFIQFS